VARRSCRVKLGKCLPEKSSTGKRDDSGISAVADEVSIADGRGRACSCGDVTANARFFELGAARNSAFALQ
jgi:hypothetical protein